MKKWIGLLFAVLFALFVQAGWADAAAAQTKATIIPKLYLNGKQLEGAAPPALVNSSVLVPVRVVAENLGYKVGWDSKSKQVTVEEGSTKILMTLEQPEASVNGQKVKLTSPPILQSDTTLIPIRFVGEAFGLQVMWDNETKSAFLFTDPSVEDPSPEDGELIGVVEGEDPASGTDGGNPVSGGEGSAGSDSSQGGESGSHPETEPSGGTKPNNPDSGNAPVDPNLVTAKLTRLHYEPDMVVLTYEGTLKPAMHVLRDPDRIVIDLPHVEFDLSFSAGFSSGIAADYMVMNEGDPAPGTIAELAGTGHAALEKIRYSRYSSSPATVRIVLDLNQRWGYEVIEPYEGRTIIKLKPETEPVKNGYTVVLDAGHGGSDPGARSVTGKWEKDFNLSVVKKVQKILASDSKINLVLTRSGDTYPTLDERVELANSLQADLFISVHGNSYKPDINGTETYYTRENSLEFARLLHKNAVAATGFKDNGVRSAGFKVIKYTTMPAVLLEVGYLSNESNERMMYDDAFQDRVAAAIAASIQQYFRLT